MKVPRRRAVAPALIALTLTGCGSGLTAHPEAASKPSTPLITHAAAPVVTPSSTTPNSTFHVTLGGAAPSRHGRAPSASGSIKVLPSRQELCWSFSKLVGVAHPTLAHINIGAISAHGGETFIKLGARYATRGCTKVIASALGELLDGTATDYYVVIDGAKHPFELTGLL
jgi:hypothetical protein